MSVSELIESIGLELVYELNILVGMFVNSQRDKLHVSVWHVR